MKKKTRNRLLAVLVAFLIAGLYIDVKMMPKARGICVKSWKQRMLVIQTIVPFMPERETLFLGVGNRHYEHEHHVDYYVDEDTREVLGTREFTYGCAPNWFSMQGKGRVSNFNDHYHYINLRPFSEIKNFGEIEEFTEVLEMPKEHYLEWYAR